MNAIHFKNLVAFLISLSIIITPYKILGQFDCSNYNAFLDNGQINTIDHLLSRVLRDGTMYLNPDYKDSVDLILQRIIQSGSTFQMVTEINSALDTSKIFKKYQQYYYDVEVEGGGYSMAFIRPGGPGPCPLIPYMISPSFKTGISINLTPSISSSSLEAILDADRIDNSALVISHSLSDQCEYKLTYRVTYMKGSSKLSYVDAQTGNIITTIDNKIGIGAPTDTYGPVTFENRVESGVTFLESPDQKISVYFQGEDCSNLHVVDPTEWLVNTIPSTSASNWGNEALPAVYQAYYVSSKVLPFYDELGINFTKLNVGYCTDDNAGAYKVSPTKLSNAHIVLSELDGVTTALFDVVAHEMAHAFLTELNIHYYNLENQSIQEGIADIYGTYVEYRINGQLYWVVGNDELVVADIIDRDLANPPSNMDCFSEVLNLNRYDRSRPLSHWFYLLTIGSPEIPPLAMSKTMGIIKDALSMLGGFNVDYPQLMEKTLIVSEDKYGVCSAEFFSIARGWEKICVDTHLPKNSNGLIETCYFSISGDSYVCEEDDSEEFCIENGLQNSNYIFTIIGPKSTSFTSACGMQGNSQTGCSCLTLTDFPKYDYYPQILTIEVQATNDNLPFKQRKRFILLDCNNDDPTCEEYFNLDYQQPTLNATLTEENLNILELHKELSDSAGSVIFNEFIHENEFINIYDILGRLLYVGIKSEFNSMEVGYKGLAIMISFTDIETVKTINKIIIQ